MNKSQAPSKSPTRFLSTYERDDVVRDADVNVGRRLKSDRVKNGVFKNDRSAVRKKVNKPVRIGLSKSKFWIKGTLKDISTTGAMVSVESGLFVSHEVILYDVEEGYMIRCALVRNSMDRIGLRFISKKVRVFPSTSKFYAEVSLDAGRKVMAGKKPNSTPTRQPIRRRPVAAKRRMR